MSNLKHSNVVPLYIQLADKIKASIDNKEIKFGEQIPSESQLSEIYSVSRITVRKAVERLVESNILVKRQGKGTFVAFPGLVENVCTNDGSFTAFCLKANVEPGTQVIKKSIIKSTSLLQKRLKLESPCELVEVHRIRYVNGYAAVYEEDYFTLRYKFLMELELDDKSIFDIIRDRVDIVPSNFVDIFQVKYANKVQAKHLQVKLNEPLLGVSQTVFDNNDNIIYYNEQTIRSDIYKYTIKSY